MVRTASLALIAALLVTSCASTPPAGKESADYVRKGTVSQRFAGNEFYMAIGAVPLYKYDFWGNLEPTDQTTEIAAVVQADKTSGEVLRIASAGSASGDGAISDLRGGLSLIDAQSYPSWLEAIDAMRQAMDKLDPHTRLVEDGVVSDAPLVAVMDFGWAWPWYPYPSHRHFRKW